ncbi:MMPL family transporter [Corynebacterium flavescens]
MNSQTIRRFRWLSLLLLILGAAALTLGGVDQPESGTSTLPKGAESTTVAQLQEKAAQEDSDASSAQAALVFFSSEQQLDLAAMAQRAAELGGPLIPSDDGTAALIPVEVPAGTATDNAAAVANLRESAAHDLPAGVNSQVTGPAAIQADLANVFEGANFLLLSVTAAIVAILLIITYRSPVLWILPLAVIGVADRVAATLFTYVLDAFGLSWNESTAGILSVLVFGAGTNYALLLISRYREELTRHEDRFSAMARSWLPTLKTVSASAGTVILGVACLLLSSVPVTQGLGAAAMVGIAVAWVFALFVLPGVLVTFGRWIFWPRRPEAGHKLSHGFWDRVGGVVAKRPKQIVACSIVALGICSLGCLQINTGITEADQFIDTPESISAASELEEAFPQQSATPPILATRDASATQAQLASLGATATARPGNPEGWTLLQVSGADIDELRTAFSGSDVLVGGPEAELMDEEAAAASDREIIFPLILLLILGALIIMLRSLLAPLIMVASVLLTNLAALGLGWWLSHYVFGFDALASTTPLYAFVFLVALGIDYTIFLITRARENARDMGTRRGILTSLSATGGVITSAGVLLAAVFAALGVLPLVVLAQLGITVFVGVLLDTLIVRTLLVPALVELLGEKFWWPARGFTPAESRPA